jgi:hypothetical protein
MNSGVADRDKSKRGVERVGFRIWRIQIDLAANPIMSGAERVLEQIVVQRSRAAPAACRRSDHDAVDVNEPLKPVAEPKIVRAVVSGGFVEDQHEGVEVADAACQERFTE